MKDWKNTVGDVMEELKEAQKLENNEKAEEIGRTLAGGIFTICRG